MEKNRIPNQSINQSLSHSPSLFDALGTEAFASEKPINSIEHTSRRHSTTIAHHNTPRIKKLSDPT